MDAIVLEPAIALTDEQFEALCRQNPERNFEMSAKGELIVVAPVGGESGRCEIQLLYQLEGWNEAHRLGIAFSSQTCFKLPNGAKRMPDAAWVRRDRWQALSPAERQGFVPFAPDFAAEIRSPADPLPPLQAKLREYLDAGVRLAWLIDPQRRVVEIYRPEREVEVLQAPTELSGEAVLPDFICKLSSIWTD
ncbi:Uma2 family endonuclease [Synechococcus sp. PCC 7336]|uniref:Uma2 family endonuclease n=1 Tax=Synechococcus sp. PCC 7336 TaxID=195250 RepID=UPI000345F379|nr:Uma2 family endonuclease [Synechococcus sp. PCC 7336]